MPTGTTQWRSSPSRRKAGAPPPRRSGRSRRAGRHGGPRCPRPAGAPGCRSRRPGGILTSSHSLATARPSPSQRSQALRRISPSPPQSPQGREKIMCPRLPRTVPLPWQRGQGAGPNATSPAPRQAGARLEAHEVDAARRRPPSTPRSSRGWPARGPPRARRRSGRPAARPSRRSRGSPPSRCAPGPRSRTPRSRLPPPARPAPAGSSPAVVRGAALRVGEHLERLRRLAVALGGDRVAGVEGRVQGAREALPRAPDLGRTRRRAASRAARRGPWPTSCPPPRRRSRRRRRPSPPPSAPGGGGAPGPEPGVPADACR